MLVKKGQTRIWDLLCAWQKLLLQSHCRHWSRDNVLSASPRKCAKQFGSTVCRPEEGACHRSPVGHFLSSSTLCFPIPVSGGIGGVDTQGLLEELKEGNTPCRAVTCLTAEIQISLRLSSEGNTLLIRLHSLYYNSASPPPPERTYLVFMAFLPTLWVDSLSAGWRMRWAEPVCGSSLVFVNQSSEDHAGESIKCDLDASIKHPESRTVVTQCRNV